MKEMILICMMGLPRSGKTTWARRQGFPIVGPDEVRYALHGMRYAANAEPFVWAITRVMVQALFRAGHDTVILDATNTTLKRRREWVNGPWAARFKFINTDAATCIARAEASLDKEIVPVIQRMASQFEPLGDDELVYAAEAAKEGRDEEANRVGSV